MSDTDLELLAAYAREKEDDVFAEIVRRHLDLVYAAALRQVRSPQLAEEVAQSVFLELARRAGRLSSDTLLAAWLYKVTHRMALNSVRAEVRRQAREQTALEMNAMDANTRDWKEIEPLLDEGMLSLDERDRAAVLLRYFENKSLREVGQFFGTSEDAAQKRVSRAVERLREFFLKRGIPIGSSSLAVAISANAAQAAPVGLSAAIAAAAGASTFAMTVSPMIAMTKLQASLVGAFLVAGIATTTLITGRNAAARQREFADALQEKDAQLEELQSQNQRLLAAARSPAAIPASSGDPAEILRLRGEVARLRADARELARLKAAAGQSQPLDGTLKLLADRVSRLKNSLEQMPEKRIPELELLKDTDWLDAAKRDRDLSTDEGVRSTLGSLRNAGKRKFGNLIRDALKNYTDANDNQLPPNFEALKPFFQEPIADSILQRYGLTRSGSIADLRDDGTPRNARDLILVAEQSASVDPEHDLNFQFALGGILTFRPGDPRVVDYIGYGEEDNDGPGAEIEVRQPRPATP
ncbi:MAG: sigma-70 family RNA polymerase sigma factor [Verrucomicrobiae bacterium]|nr:sigma-70 family RNA polymerase sigma factor [Verrucomicrobiae bacterium]